MKTDRVLRITPDPGESIQMIANAMEKAVNDTDEEVICEFNGTSLTVKRGDTAADIVAYYFTSREK